MHCDARSTTARDRNPPTRTAASGLRWPPPRSAPASAAPRARSPPPRGLRRGRRSAAPPPASPASSPRRSPRRAPRRRRPGSAPPARPGSRRAAARRSHARRAAGERGPSPSSPQPGATAGPAAGGGWRSRSWRGRTSGPARRQGQAPWRSSGSPQPRTGQRSTWGTGGASVVAVAARMEEAARLYRGKRRVGREIAELERLSFGRLAAEFT